MFIISLTGPQLDLLQAILSDEVVTTQRQVEAQDGKQGMGVLLEGMRELLTLVDNAVRVVAS